MKIYIFVSAILIWGLNAVAADSGKFQRMSSAVSAGEKFERMNAVAADGVKFQRLSQSAEVEIDISSTEAELKAATDKAYNSAMKEVSASCDPYWSDSNLFDVVTMNDERRNQDNSIYVITATISGLCKKHPRREAK